MGIKRAVITLHGIRTRGVWQKQLATFLAMHGFIPCSLDYGRFPLRKIAWPRARKRTVDWLEQEVEKVKNLTGCKRPSIIAHSFGTYLIARLLQRNEYFAIDKLILCGAVVDRDYDWAARSKQVNLVHNDQGRKDLVSSLARLVPGMGRSGSNGFTRKCGLLTEHALHHQTHDSFFNPDHFRKDWIPILRRLTLSEVDKKNIRDLLELAVLQVAQLLPGVDRRLLRANVFLEQEPGMLSIPPGLHVNMNNENELGIEIRAGTGCTGTVHSSRVPAIAILKEDWGKHQLLADVLKNVDRRLKWIVSSPIPDLGRPGAVLGALNVDCLDIQKSESELGPVLVPLVKNAQLVAEALESTA